MPRKKTGACESRSAHSKPANSLTSAPEGWADIPEVTNVAELVRSTLVATKS